MESQIQKMPNLTQHKSTADFLKSYFQIMKSFFGPNQVKTWSTSLGVQSRITFKHLLSGRRELSKEQKQKLNELLDLGENKKSETPQSTYCAPPDFFSTPANTIILNLCGLKKKMTEEKIHSMLSSAFNEKEIQEAIQKLLDLNLIQVQKGQYLVRVFEGVITTLPGVKSNHSEMYFKKINELEEQALSLPLSEREFNSYSFRIKAEDFGRAKDLIRDLRKQLIELSDPDERDSVYQCSVSLFPVHKETE